MEILNQKLSEQLKSLKSCKGFDLKLKMSINYLNRYYKGWRDIDFISIEDYSLRQFALDTNIFEYHHKEVDGEYVLVKMYPMEHVLNHYTAQLKNKENEQEYIKEQIAKISAYRTKLVKEKENLIKTINESMVDTPNKLICRIPHLSPSLYLYETYKNSLTVDQETFIKSSIFNSDPLLDKLINFNRFEYVAKGDISRLFVDYERLVGNNSEEEKNGYSFIPLKAVSYLDIFTYIPIRRYEDIYKDPNYLTFINKWVSFNKSFEDKAKLISNQTQKHLFVLSLHSFSEMCIKKKFPNFRKRKFPDLNIVFSKNTPRLLLEKIKRKIYKLDHIYKIKTSFSFPYNDTYETSSNFNNKTICFTIEINKKIYLKDPLILDLKEDLFNIRKFLDDLFLYLLKL